MNITVGAYKQTGLTFYPNSRKLTVYGVTDLFDLKTIQLLTIQRNSAAFPIIAPSFCYASISGTTPTTAPVIVSTSIGGTMTAGYHKFVYTYVLGNNYETLISAPSTIVQTDATNKTVNLTIPTGPPATVQRFIYKIPAAASSAAAATGTTYYQVGSLTGNTNTAFTLTASDSTATVAPTTSYCYDIIYANSITSQLQVGDNPYLVVNVPDNTVDYNMDFLKVMLMAMAELPPMDPEISIVTDTNLAVNTYYYELPQGSFRNFVGQIKATSTATPSVIRIYATLDSTIAVTSTGGSPSVDWVDITEAIFGIKQIGMTTTNTYVSPIFNWAVDEKGNQVMYDRFMVSYQVFNATNFININVRKF